MPRSWIPGAGTMVLIMIIAASAPRGAQAQPSGEPLTLAALEQMALAQNPTLTQAAADVTAADALARQAGRWPNPSIGYTADEVSGGPVIRWGEHGVFVEQVFPISGRLGADRAVRRGEADEARAHEAAQRQRVLTMVRLHHREAALAAERVAIRDELARHAADVVTTTRQLANIGIVDRPDLLEAEADAHAAQVAAEAARHDEWRIWRELGVAVGDPSLRPAPLAADPAALPPPVDEGMALAVLLRDSPELRAAEAAVTRAAASVVRARKETKPDLVVRAGPRYNRELLDHGPSPVGMEAFADVGVTIPLWNRNRDGIAAAEAELTRARAEVSRVELDLRARFAGEYQTYAAGADDVRAYRDEIIPRADEAHRLRLERYRQMMAEYTDVLTARQRLFTMREMYLDALGRAWRAAILIDGLLLEDGLMSP
ncbi:MAG: TolC family protein [Acidobacteria bacterium]|nr:TolC family protein [Acidobacteriota bacterium]